MTLGGPGSLSALASSSRHHSAFGAEPCVLAQRPGAGSHPHALAAEDLALLWDPSGAPTSLDLCVVY